MLSRGYLALSFLTDLDVNTFREKFSQERHFVRRLVARMKQTVPICAVPVNPEAAEAAEAQNETRRDQLREEAGERVLLRLELPGGAGSGGRVSSRRDDGTKELYK